MYIIVLSKNPNSRFLYCVRMNSAVYCMVHNGMHIIGNHKIIFTYCDHNSFVHVFKESPRKMPGTRFAQTNNKIIRDKSMQPPIPMWYKCKNINNLCLPC